MLDPLLSYWVLNQSSKFASHELQKQNLLLKLSDLQIKFYIWTKNYLKINFFYFIILVVQKSKHIGRILFVNLV